MSQGDIHIMEIVEVDQNETEPLAVAPKARAGAFQNVDETALARQAGHGIGSSAIVFEHELCASIFGLQATNLTFQATI
jgi:hypothetical protein